MGWSDAERESVGGQTLLVERGKSRHGTDALVKYPLVEDGRTKGVLRSRV